MKMSIIDQIKLSFAAFMEEYHFHPITTKVSSSFGDALEVFESEEFKLRFVSDRGQPFVEIASKTEESRWLDLNLLRAVILNVTVSHVGIEELAAFLTSNYSSVKEALSPGQVEKTIKKLRQLRSGVAQ
jgi:hypothetical protein